MRQLDYQNLALEVFGGTLQLGFGSSKVIFFSFI